MAAADAVIVPLQCEFFALEGLTQLLNTIELVRENLNPDLEIQGIVLTMFDKRNKLSDQVAADVREHMGDKVYNTDDPAQCADFRSAEPRASGAGLRSALPGQSGLHQAGRRTDPARADAGGSMSAERTLGRRNAPERAGPRTVGPDRRRGSRRTRRARAPARGADRFSATQPLSAAQDLRRGRSERSVASVKEKGILQPILVRPIAGETNAFEIVAGERRWRAAQAAKLHDVPVLVREMSDGEALELAIIENVQRSDLNAVEEAAGYQELMDRFGYTQEKLASEVGKSRHHVANTLRLLKLPESGQEHGARGQLTAGHARTLIGAPRSRGAGAEIVAGALNVRQAEQRSKAKERYRTRPPVEDPNIKALERSLSNRLGLKVQVIDRGG